LLKTTMPPSSSLSLRSRHFELVMCVCTGFLRRRFGSYVSSQCCLLVFY
jgi:hypothetical protein